jgi:hypothetical protein
MSQNLQLRWTHDDDRGRPRMVWTVVDVEREGVALAQPDVA